LGLPLPWVIDPSRFTTYDENLLKRMIIFRNAYERMKAEREKENEKETVHKPEGGFKGRVKRPKRHVKKPSRKH
jgi:hypothetical protein